MKKAIVIGASSGIGKVLAQELTKMGYHVGITGRRQVLLEALKAQAPDKFTVSTFDCTETCNTQALSDLTEELGGLDLLVMSSGRACINRRLVFSEEKETLDLNVLAFTEVVTWGFNYFNKQGHGHLIAISSIAGLRGSGLYPSYYASKAYQINYLEGLRQKAYKLGKPIYIMEARPGFVDTAMAQGKGIFWVAPVQKAAKQIIRAISQKKNVVYITKRWRFIGWILKILPPFIHKRM